jgi:hypothetical protein
MELVMFDRVGGDYGMEGKSARVETVSTEPPEQHAGGDSSWQPKHARRGAKE